MNKDFLDFVKKLTIKRMKKNNDDTKDINQEVLIDLFEKGINEIKGNELKINGIIVYHINKWNRLNNSNKIITVDNDNYFDIKQDLNPNSEYELNSNKLNDLYSEFLVEYGYLFNEENLKLFYNIKFLKMSYKELNKDSATYRKKVSDIYIFFKNYIFEKGLKLNVFFNEKE